MQYTGLHFSHGDIVVCNSDMMHQHPEAGCHFASMSLTNEDLDAGCKAITGREFAAQPFTHLVRPSVALMGRLSKVHETIGNIAKNSPDLFDLPEAVRALEQQLTYLMVRCLTEGSVSAMTDSAHRHDVIVARFEAFLEANPNQPLYLPEICAAVGVAERTFRIICDAFTSDSIDDNGN
jgi:hypothetical protein